MNTYQFHTKEELRQELANIDSRIWAAKQFKWQLTPSQKRAMEAKRDHLRFLLSTRR